MTSTLGWFLVGYLLIGLVVLYSLVTSDPDFEKAVEESDWYIFSFLLVIATTLWLPLIVWFFLKEFFDGRES
jgi:bacteriorhodopsin